MQRLSNVTRISIGLTLITLSVLAGAYVLGLVPHRSALEGDRRLRLSQSMAVQFSIALERDDPGQMLRLAESILGHTPDILSIAIRRADDSLLFASANHEAAWGLDATGQTDTKHLEVPLYDEVGVLWGNVEVMFTPLPGILQGEWALFMFITASCLLGFMLYMLHTLRALDPSQIVPERVNGLLNTFTEGVLVIDLNDRIMLANQALGVMLDRDPAALLGTKASELDWLDEAFDQAPTTFPWSDTADNNVCRGQSIRLLTPNGPRTLGVNATPILGADQQVRGVLMTFGGVTSIEGKNRQLEEKMPRLCEARDRVNRENKSDLQLALEAEQLSGALLRHNVTSIGELAERLQATETALGQSEATEIGDAADIDYELDTLLSEVNELLGLVTAATPPTDLNMDISDPQKPCTTDYLKHDLY